MWRNQENLSDYGFLYKIKMHYVNFFFVSANQIEHFWITNLYIAQLLEL
jgi:hypothetical protein